jgi:hypothetical protein
LLRDAVAAIVGDSHPAKVATCIRGLRAGGR